MLASRAIFLPKPSQLLSFHFWFSLHNCHWSVNLNSTFIFNPRTGHISKHLKMEMQWTGYLLKELIFVPRSHTALDVVHSIGRRFCQGAVGRRVCVCVKTHFPMPVAQTGTVDPFQLKQCGFFFSPFACFCLYKQPYCEHCVCVCVRTYLIWPKQGDAELLNQTDAVLLVTKVRKSFQFDAFI